MTPPPPEYVEAARMPGLYRFCWTLMLGVSRLFFRWQVHGVEHIPPVGPVILAANHVSYLYPPLVGAAVPRAVNILARESLFRVPLMGWLIRRLKAVPVDREGGGGAGLKAILDRLAAGGGIILFPEGTRSRDGTIQPAKAGIGLTIIKSDAPVIPVRLLGAYEAWGRHRLLPRPRRVTLVFGPPLDFAAARAESAGCPRPRLKAIYQEVADELMAAIARLEPPSPGSRLSG